MTKKQRELLMQIDEEKVVLDVYGDACTRFLDSEDGMQNPRYLARYNHQKSKIKTLRQQFIECED